MAPRTIRCIRPQAFLRRFFSAWNIHLVVFSGGVEQGLGGPTALYSWKIRQNRGWEAQRLAGFFDWNTSSSFFFLAALNRGLEARRLNLV